MSSVIRSDLARTRGKRGSRRRGGSSSVRKGSKGRAGRARSALWLVHRRAHDLALVREGRLLCFSSIESGPTRRTRTKNSSVDLFSSLLPSSSSYGLPSFNRGDGFTNAQCELLYPSVTVHPKSKLIYLRFWPRSVDEHP